MTRWYDTRVADLFDVVPARALLLGLFLVTLVGSFLWYWYPAWVPRRWPRFRLPRLRMPRLRLHRRRPPATPTPAPRRRTAPRPEPAATADADLLAAEGRYDEAILQRLRDTVRDLTRAGVIAPQPGTTAAELSVIAVTNVPVITREMEAATALFSEVWYGRRQARAEHDEHMRRLTGSIRSAVLPEAGR